ncbi:MAG: ABC transporter ATP-binding protein [Pseudobdellovibrionaceae bacterium]
MTDAIHIQNLTKTYAATGKSSAKTALRDVSLTIPAGSIYGLLGPNGAGKSTLINILAGLVLKTSGSVSIWGTDIDENPRQSRANIGIVPQELNFDPFFSPKRLLDLQAGLYGVPAAERKSMALLTMLGLADKANAYTRSLSGGMRRRLMVAKAMVHSPPILVLDEPTAGVDVDLRNQLWENVRALNKQGVTILLTTHYLQEAEELCDRIAIINHGRIIADEPTETLLARMEGKDIRFTLTSPLSTIPDTLSAFHPVIEDPHTLTVHYNPRETDAGIIIGCLQDAGIAFTDIVTSTPRLEDIFLRLTQAA